MSQNDESYGAGNNEAGRDPLYTVPKWAMVTAATIILLAFAAGALSAAQVFV
jgi:hypothetical protein